MNLIRKIYDWTLEKAERENALYWLTGIAFIEAIFFPIPPDILLIPICLASKRNAMKAALYCTIASVLGGLIGYSMGLFLFEQVGKPILEMYNAWGKYDKVKIIYDSYGFLGVFIAALSPIPYKVFTIASGSFQFEAIQFIFASILGRGLRFFLVAFLIRTFGEKIREILDQHFNKATLIFSILLIGGFLAVKFVF